MDRRIIFWLALAFIAGGMLAARQNILEHQNPGQLAPTSTNRPNTPKPPVSVPD